MKIPKAGELYSHKDGGVYKVVGTQIIANTFETASNIVEGRKGYFKLMRVKATLVWYSPISNDMDVYVRTLPHFLDSFSDTTKDNA